MSPKTRDQVGDLRARRLELELTQQELAARAQCSIAMVALVEGGYRPARLSAVIERIVTVLNESGQAAKSDPTHDAPQGDVGAPHGLAA
jgi:predicted transcriptional regulator